MRPLLDPQPALTGDSVCQLRQIAGPFALLSWPFIAYPLPGEAQQSDLHDTKQFPEEAAGAIFSQHRQQLEYGDDLPGKCDLRGC